MRKSWRIRLTWTLAIVYGFVSAMGEGLHLLPGQCHDVFCRGEACCGDACGGEDRDSGQCDDCGLAVAQLHEPSGSAQLAAATPGAHGHDHCAICEFFAQGTWFLRPVAVPQWQFFRGYERPSKAIFIACRSKRPPFLSRAPPAPVDC
jgi:hypothetical protein